MHASMILALLVFAGLAFVAVYMDVKHRSLPNWLCALAWAFGLVSVAVASGGFGSVASAFAHSGIALAAGMALFGAGMIGGGDAKLYAGLAAWFPLGQGPLLLVAVCLAGLVLTLAMWFPLRRRNAKLGSATNSQDSFAKVPFGVAIATGALVAFLSSAGAI